MTGTGNSRKKAGQAGTAKLFLTRNQAIKKLQISLPDFRRLCIFKGVYPREPRYRKKVSKSATHDTTFYYTKDIQYLLHEPVLQRFREHKAFAKKLTRYLGRGDEETVVRLERTQTPKITLDHVIKERYPTFIDALRDLDDALCLLFLFANLPTSSNVPAAIIAQCQKLCFEFQHFIIISRSLRKSFLSIKGIYYQAEVHGQEIMWIVPYGFMQRVTADIDYRIMATFVEFYTTLIGFVNFKLYAERGLIYPPKLDAKMVDQAAGLRALQVENQTLEPENNQLQHVTNGSTKPISVSDNEEEQQKLIDALPAKIAALGATGEDPGSGENGILETENGATEESTSLDVFDTADPTADALEQPQDFLPSESRPDPLSLFSDFTFFLSRETPRHSLEFLLRAFGCRRVGWDEILGEGAYTNHERDERITHQIVDRPPVFDSAEDELRNADEEALASTEQNEVDEVRKILRPGLRVPGRIYVQPQWVWDSVNAGKLLRPDLYAPGAILPPHLSPWMRAGPGDYDPEKPLEEQESEAEAIEGDAELRETLRASEADDQSENALERAAGLKPLNLDEGEMTVDLGEQDDTDEDDDFASFEHETAPEPVEAMVNVMDPSDSEDGLPALSEHQKELQEESQQKSAERKALNGANAAEDDQAAKIKRIKKRRREEEEELERRKGMLSGKKKKIYESLSRDEKKQSDQAKKLRQKRRALEQQLG